MERQTNKKNTKNHLTPRAQREMHAAVGNVQAADELRGRWQATRRGCYMAVWEKGMYLISCVESSGITEQPKWMASTTSVFLVLEFREANEFSC